MNTEFLNMNTKTNPPHDSYFLTSMSKPKVARDFFKAHLPCHVYEQLDLEYLDQCKQSYVEEHLKKKIVDVLYKTKFKSANDSTDVYLYILTEAQSTPEKLMSFRLMKYIFLIMADHLQQYNTHTLPVVIPLVLYNGKSTYCYSTDIFTLFGDHAQLAKEVLLKPFHLIDLNTIDDETLREHASAALMEWCMKHIRSRNMLQYIDFLKDLLESIELEKDTQYFVQTITYIMYNMDEQKAQEFVQNLADKLPKSLAENAMNIAERLREEGIQQGEHTLLLHLLQRKFHQVPENYRKKLDEANPKDLLTWGERILDASSLDEIFKK